ncbi:DUF421 domain-containing protein [Parasphingopyxis marina]|uniref:DUF421 domain-containing protein n=1 Tax=Parasphingopyxis marina TaxID=2761622 RepID=A0A842HXK1_9SPHN|nr:YetF domain-containing protein [Parasphingopyxis marina]MBC2777157.1 DUF421 domain-containing protein [Parasphingopyxis marina]
MFGLPPEYDLIVRGLVLTAVVLAWVLLLVRILGLRSFSKMTAFDFVITVATGSLLAQAGTASQWKPFAQTLIVIAALFLLQFLIAKARQSSDRVEGIIDNTPRLLMRDGRFIDAALDETRVSRSDIFAKLREANVLHLAAVRAVVLETTGDISVLHGDDLEDELLEGVGD